MTDQSTIQRQEMLEINKRQTCFYETPAANRPLNLAMKFWSRLRGSMFNVTHNSGIWAVVFDLQKSWIGDLKDKKVLDLGCYQGNALSGHLASSAASYLAIDLSQPALDKLNSFFVRKGINHARLQCIDVLSPDFTESGFDIIYAAGVLHHFKNLEVLLQVLLPKLASGGKIISHDPIQTSILTRIVRAAYHPFRNDRDWEWPLTRGSFDIVRRYFVVRHIQGFMGYSKWALPVAYLHQSTARKLAKYLHNKDRIYATHEGPALWGCLQVVMCLEKRGTSVPAIGEAPL